MFIAYSLIDNDCSEIGTYETLPAAIEDFTTVLGWENDAASLQRTVVQILKDDVTAATITYSLNTRDQVYPFMNVHINGDREVQLYERQPWHGGFRAIRI